MSKSNFENLRVYQLSEQIADLIWDIVAKWPAFARDTVGKQIVRAADSIGANIAEGMGWGTHLDNKRFVRTGRRSLYEPSTGSAAPTSGVCWPRPRSRNSSRSWTKWPRGSTPT